MTGEDKILEEAKKRFRTAKEAERINIQNAKEDFRFFNGQQWPEPLRRDRENEHRPCLVINKLPERIDIVVGAMKQNRPDIKIRPVDSDADPYTAEVFTGLIKNIEDASDAKVAYDNAFEQALIAGWGYWRIVTCYSDDDTFKQDIRIQPIFNPFSVYWDPNCKDQVYKTDAKYVLVTHKLSKDVFKRRYPKVEISDFDLDNDDVGWIDKDNIVVVEYFKKEPIVKRLFLMPDGSVVDKIIPGYPEPIRERIVKSYKIVRYLLTGTHVIEGPSEWPSKYFPIIPCWGKETIVDGRRVLRGMVRFAKDAQRMYNYWRSMATEVVALAPKMPWVGTAKQFEGYESIWDSAHLRSLTRLMYNPDPKAPGPPQRVQPPTIPTGLANEAAMTSDEIKSTTGIYDASLGARSNETSGTAILARQKQGDLNTFSFVDNLARALRLTGKVLVDLIPKIYSDAKVVRILGPDNSQKFVKLNTPYVDKNENGNPVLKFHDLTVGKYDVVVDTGPSYMTMRQEAANTMLEVLRYAPQLSSVLIDLIAESLDWPNKDAFIARMRKILPPGLTGDVDQTQNQQGPQQPQQDPLEALKLNELNAKIAKIHADVEGKALDNYQKQLELGIRPTGGQQTPGNFGQGAGNE